MRIRFFSLIAATLLVVAGTLALPAGAPAQAPDFDIPNGHFFSQAAGGSGQGFTVTDDDGVAFWREFRRFGGAQAVGYPISERFIWDGFVCQAFQRVVFQWRPERGEAFFVNTFDDMHRAGFDDYLEVVRQTPQPAVFDEAGKPFDQVTTERLALLDTNPAIKAAYFGVVGDPIQYNGLPTTAVTDMGILLVLRAQRVVFQQWKIDVPWARAGQVTVALGGDISKEVGLLPDPAALAPVSPPEAEAPFSPRAETVASGLRVPWALAFAPDGRLFFTERPGRLRVISNGQLQAAPVAQLPAVETAESGLMGLAVDPAFAQNGFLYVMYTFRDTAGGLHNRVSRLTESQGRAANEVVLLDNLPAGSIHDGGRIKFGPDGKLYVTQGETGNTSLSQNLGSLGGKIMRINPDGSIPGDNPFPGSTVYSFGHRNPEGLAWQPGTGTMWSTEHGPVGNDEVNIIRAGANYGWPVITGRAGNAQFSDPILLFTPSVAPAGATFYNGSKLSPWRGNLFFGTLAGQHLHRVVLGGPGLDQVVSEERMFQGAYGRLRDVAEGPDGFLYFSTSNHDGRGNPGAADDRILRIVP